MNSAATNTADILTNSIITRKKRLRNTFPLQATHGASIHSISFDNSIICSSNGFAEELHYKGEREYSIILLFHLLLSPYQSPANTIIRPIDSSKATYSKKICS